MLVISSLCCEVHFAPFRVRVKKKMKAIWCSCLLVLASRHAVVSVLASLPTQNGVKVAVETVTAVFDVLSSKCCSGSDVY